MVAIQPSKLEPPVAEPPMRVPLSPVEPPANMDAPTTVRPVDFTFDEDPVTAIRAVAIPMPTALVMVVFATAIIAAMTVIFAK